jgi:SpoVK/Ycf46/Vps4 family AAA+-type ATPase
VLSREPANLEALRGATEAAEGTGDSARAAGYRRLLEALIGDGQPGHQQDQWAGASLGSEPRPARERLRVLRDEPEHDTWRSERPSIALDDVAGMDEVKRRLSVAFLGPLRNPELRRLFGKSLRGGLLLFGPPGCGKTFLARATAGELGAGFIAVGLSDVLDMWLGESERKLHDLFAAARRAAPAVLFFDEIDALGQRRSHLARSAGRNVVAQLLAELDGVDQSNEGVFVLGATNHPWDVDTALQRPGRFDRSVLVLPPDEVARQAILRFHLHDRPAESVDVPWVAARTREFSGADLAHLCESAAEVAMADCLQRGVARAMTTADFRDALRELRPSTRQWFEMARNYAMFANEGGMYDDLLAYMRTNRLL